MYRGTYQSSAKENSSLHENLRWRLYAHINTYCMTYVRDIAIIPCIHPSINILVQSWVLAMHIMFESQIHGLQVYRSTAKCLQTQHTDRYTYRIQLVYRGIQVYRSTGLQVYSLRLQQVCSQEAVYGIQSTGYTEYTGGIQLLSWYQVYSGIQVYSHPSGFWRTEFAVAPSL